MSPHTATLTPPYQVCTSLNLRPSSFPTANQFVARTRVLSTIVTHPCTHPAHTNKDRSVCCLSISICYTTNLLLTHNHCDRLVRCLGISIHSLPNKTHFLYYLPTRTGLSDASTYTNTLPVLPMSYTTNLLFNHTHCDRLARCLGISICYNTPCSPIIIVTNRSGASPYPFSVYTTNLLFTQ